MKKNIIKYSIKLAFRNRESLFWVVIFPFILVNIFGILFSNMEDINLEPLTIMVESPSYREALSHMEYNGKKMYKVVEYKSPEKALDSGKIQAYVEGYPDKEISDGKGNRDGKVSVNIKKSDTEEKVLVKNVNALREKNKVELKNHIKGSEKSTMAVAFYSLIGMICLGAMNFGITAVENTDPDSDVKSVKRIIIAPVPRKTVIINEVLPLFILNCITTILMYLFMRYVYNVNFGGSQAEIIFGLICSNIMAVTIGIFFANLVKAKTSVKYSMGAMFYVFSGFLSGMMSTGTYGFFSNAFPILNYINPATVITKMLLSLYIFNDTKKYMFSIVNILAISVVMILFSIILYKRKNRGRV